ncbi:MAG TPA: hypothetical protein PKD51_10135, partial [Saprospiraceae bacterium]|nr:hypothetical protein [Saprospiraceae bacterium]
NAHNRIKGDYFKFTETDLKSLINLYDSLKYPTNKPTDAKESEKSLYDNVYVNDHVNESDSENVNADNAVQIPPTPEISKGLPEFILPAPGDPSQQIFYETEICMPLHFTIDEATLIHNKWLSVNFGKLFTLKEARINFKGYASSWRFNKGSSPPPPKVVEFTPITPHKYSDQG